MRQAATGGREFLIKWESYNGPTTWEPEANLLPSLVREFLDSQTADTTEDTEDTDEAAAAAPAAPRPPRAKAKGGKAATSGKRPAAEPPAPAQPKRTAAEPPRAPAQPELVVGSAMEVQGCSEDCDLSCTVCDWEACTIVMDHGATCDVRITSDGDLCQGVQRRHLRPVARAVGKRATAAAEREGAPLKQARPPHVAAPSGSGKRKKRSK